MSEVGEGGREVDKGGKWGREINGEGRGQKGGRDMGKKGGRREKDWGTERNGEGRGKE